jgi:hypothetical protein
MAQSLRSLILLNIAFSVLFVLPVLPWVATTHFMKGGIQFLYPPGKTITQQIEDIRKVQDIESLRHRVIEEAKTRDLYREFRENNNKLNNRMYAILFMSFAFSSGMFLLNAILIFFVQRKTPPALEHRSP